MELILLENIRNLGGLGDKVDVRSGYGRNFLIPLGKAVPANEANVKVFEERRAELEAKAKEVVAAAQARAEYRQIGHRRGQFPGRQESLQESSKGRVIEQSETRGRGRSSPSSKRRAEKTAQTTRLLTNGHFRH